MTEDEAKTKWCPMAGNRVIRWKDDDGEHFIAATDGVHHPSPTCVGPGCMAWRWRGERYGNVVELRPAVAESGVYVTPEGFQYRTGGPNGMWVRHAVVTEGYCGLAGVQQ